jgi:hypothetical protein
MSKLPDDTGTWDAEYFIEAADDAAENANHGRIASEIATHIWTQQGLAGKVEFSDEQIRAVNRGIYEWVMTL